MKTQNVLKATLAAFFVSTLLCVYMFNSEGKNSIGGYGFFTGSIAIFLFYLETQKKYFFEKILSDPSRTLEERKSNLIKTMIGKGYQIDTQSEAFIQFRKEKRRVWTSFFLFLFGCLMSFIAGPVGWIILLLWFILLFLGKKHQFLTVPLPPNKV